MQARRAWYQWRIIAWLEVTMKENTRAVHWTLRRLAVLGIVALVGAVSRPARAQDDGSTEVVPGMEDACIENFGRCEWMSRE